MTTITIRVNGRDYTINGDDAKQVLEELKRVCGEQQSITYSPYYAPYPVPTIQPYYQPYTWCLTADGGATS